MKNFRLALILSAIVVLGMTACSKTGDTGPAGPKGPAGPDSVSYSGWITLATPQVINGTDTSYQQVIPATALTQGILDSGVILSYMDFPDNNNSDHLSSVASLSIYGVSEDFALGNITIFSSVDLTGLTYRYVIIPGSLKVNSSEKIYKGHSTDELKQMTYEQIQQLVASPNN